MSKLGKPRSSPILVDVDGVLANFCRKVQDYIRNRWDMELDPDDQFLEVRAQAKGKWDEEAEEWIRQPGFALDLEEIPGAVDAVRHLMTTRNVVFVTSPYNKSPTWAWDRFCWLKERFPNMDRDDIIFAHDKRYVSGITLIDDRWDNIMDWSIYHQKTGILVKTDRSVPDLEKVQNIGRCIPPYYMVDHHKTGQSATFFALDNWNQIISHLEIFE